MMSASSGRKTSVPTQSSLSIATQNSQPLSSLNVQSIHLDEPTMYINSMSQQETQSIGEPILLGTAAMPFTSNLQHLSSVDEHQSLYLEQQHSLSVGMNSRSSSFISKEMLIKEQTPNFQNVISTSAIPFSTQGRIDEMKFLQTHHGSRFLNLCAQQLPTKSKQTVHREPWPKIINVTSPNMGSNQSPSIQKGSAQSVQSPKPRKTIIGNTSLQKSSSINKRSTQPTLSPKATTETFAPVRAKMRESLTASLASISDEKDRSKLKERKSASVDCGTITPEEICTQTSDTSNLVIESLPGSTSGCSPESFSPSQNDSQKCNVLEEAKDSHKKTSLEDDEANNGIFVIKDDLLQGNGLCWAPDVSIEKNERTEDHNPKRVRFSSENVTSVKEVVESENPQKLAAKIEDELFKLYGGVNKKYKEKGRSLLFNLKDRSNPELRKQVLSGDIAPERLCSMTAEELASKELSEWRIAKAEELAQMVVLPDSDVKRLVKKTHKGEFQVEVEHDDTASVEVTFGATSLLQASTRSHVEEVQTLVKSNKRKAQTKSNGLDHPDGSKLPNKTSLLDEDIENDLTGASHEKTDYMQDIFIEEIKDEELLEQVPSLDEFMKDLDSEPPFKNLTVDIMQETNISDEKSSDCLQIKTVAEAAEARCLVANLSHAGDLGMSNQNHESEDTQLDMDPASAKSIDQAVSGVKCTEASADLKSSEKVSTNKGSESSLSGAVSLDSNIKSITEVKHVWEGLIQLNISSLVTVFGCYKSGEQPSTKDWPSILEIKGRVRLDAFEKFLQELPLSRSRAIMILQFCWKEGTPESGLVSLCETADSYVSDERVGYAEPVTGVEIYFCPPHEKTNQILVKQLPKEHEEILMTTDNGLIGVVVWRRAHVISAQSPRPSSKHNSKKQSLGKKQQNTDANSAAKAHSQVGHASVNQNKHAEKDSSDDAPPGFGPPASRDEDDLPEFDYTHGSNKLSASNPNSSHAHPPTHPVDQMRQLIHKYGQTKTNDSTRPRPGKWNAEDDDIPEWQPHQEIQSHAVPPGPPPSHPQVIQQQQVVQPNTERQHLVMVPPPPPPPQLQQHLQNPPMIPLPSVVQQQFLSNNQSPISMPLQQLQPPTNGMMTLGPGVQNAHPGWQHQHQHQNQWWAPTMEPTAIPPNSMMQPYNYNGHLHSDGQPYGLPGVAWTEWRHNGHRNR